MTQLQWFHIQHQERKMLILHRIASNDFGTFGVLIKDNTPFALTLERPWQNNIRNISCIPAGEYICKAITSPRFGNTFEVTDVPGRSHILFHKGNLSDDTHGCILVGEQFESLCGTPAILASRKGFDEFMRKFRYTNSFILDIREE